MSTKDLGDIGAHAGDIFAKAFTLGYETGRKYVPAGGMALTAERMEKVRTAREELRGYRNFTGYGRSHVNRLIAAVDALFPATEPAEVISRYQTMQRGFAAKHFGFPANPVFEDRYTAPDGGKWQWTDELQWELRCYPPAPAVPAEEETKAEDYCCHPMCRHTNWGGSNRKHTRGSDCPIVPKPTSSPVVPAPTETEWQTWQEVPEGVWFLTNQNIGCWMRRDGDKVTTVTGGWPVCTDSLVAQAPFVAAEEG